MADTKLNMENMPRHVAIVMDGNGRWAKKRGMVRLQGHNQGMLALKEIVKKSDMLGIKYLTVYAFSTENWKRPTDEVSGIFKLLVLYVQNEINELHRNNVRVQILGDWSTLPKDAVKAVEGALRTTENNTGLVFSIALNYGGRAELVRAARLVAEDVNAGRLEPDQVDEEAIASRLYTGHMPDPDLIIRTSGEYRLSNFLIWQAAYSELVITDVLWPDFTPEEYERAIGEYQSRDRRFGGVK